MTAPIEDYALLSDCQSAALLSADGRVAWWPAPRFDSASAFSALLDPDAGHWSIRPRGRLEIERRYLDGTLVLETTLRAAGGTVRTRDALAFAPGARGHDLGREVPHALARTVEVLSGEVEVEVELVPRLEYGLAVPRLVACDGGVATLGGPERLFLRGDRPLEPDGGCAHACVTLHAGERAGWVLHRVAGASGSPPPALDPHQAIENAVAAWRSWSDMHAGYEGEHAAEVRFAGRMLQALTHEPSGAVVAAATTSLPEVEGGGVRVGNAAWRQKQLDVLGHVLDCAWAIRDDLGTPGAFTADFLCELADRAARQWREEDSGIWEGREGERHYTVSKLGCWVALDRALRLADRLGEHTDVTRWSRARDDVAELLLREAWSEERGPFTGALGSDRLDAGVLLLPLSGFVDVRDPRVTRTIETLEAELGDGGLLRRWTGAEDGAFLLASFWLAECHARAGRIERAEAVFERAAGCANDLGMLAEEADLATGRPLGNVPQAISHVGLVNAALALTRARRGEAVRA